ncbi:MAG: caspase family protein [Bryobacteraceae bacterium]
MPHDPLGVFPMRGKHWLFFPLLLVLALTAQDRGVVLPVGGVSRRLALVIGNNAYRDRPLQNAVNDAQAVRAALAEVGFDVDLKLNVGIAEMEDAAGEFVARVRPGDVAVFYYSGHGMQVGDQNYLIPVDFEARTAVDAKYKSYAASRIQENLEAAGVGLQIIILDACRDNPYLSLRSGAGGLAAMQAGKGTYIAFATGPGKTADDNPMGRDGLFTGALVEALREPGLTLDQVFNRVRAQVAAARPEQVPWSSSNVLGDFYFRPGTTTAKPLTDKDVLVLADFTNTTGDSVFDDTLKQGLAVQLEQSPFLKLVSDFKVNETLKLMGRPAGDRLTPEITREVCQRTNSKAMLTGSIAPLGSQYVIGLKAVNCETGEALADAQEQAAGKEAVLKALGAAATRLRTKLGESLVSVRKYDTPLEEATTPSLEALKAYSLGRKLNLAKGFTAALPFYQRATDLDPGFASAYGWMSDLYNGLVQGGLAAEYASKAYALREKVSERERFDIEGIYYLFGTGELEKAATTYELYQQTYPRDYQPYRNLGLVLCRLGDWEKALEAAREALRLEPSMAVNYTELARAYKALNRLDEAEAVDKQMRERKLEHEGQFRTSYWLAFLKGDAAQMARTVSAAAGKPGAEEPLLAIQADAEGWYGKLKNAHELTGRAMDSALHHNAQEAAAAYQAEAALREVESGYREQARAEAEAAVKLAQGRDVWVIAALALARAGDTAGAEKLAAELDKTFPLDTLVQRYWLPTIRAGVALQSKDPDRAIELLKVVSPVELGGQPMLAAYMSPAYVRGEAYLMLHDGNRAAVEFQKFIDHRGLVATFSWGALARLGLARAYALQGDTAKTRAAYQDFLTLWKDADPDVPILKEAKAEYAKLQ